MVRLGACGQLLAQSRLADGLRRKFGIPSCMSSVCRYFYCERFLVCCLQAIPLSPISTRKESGLKICSKCQMPYSSVLSSCVKCGHQAARKNGFAAFAPELEDKQEGFKAHFYDTYAYLESGHFWFRARAKLIVWALKKYVPHMHSFLEIGCGTGFILSRVATAFPQTSLLGSEMFTTALNFASSLLPSVDFAQMDARKIPYIDEFEAIGAFDVIEHIEADCEVLQQIYRALKPEGVMLLTVPQHQWLWSQVDEYSGHVRRYDVAELHHKVERAGFVVLRSTSFITLLLPAMIVSRWSKKYQRGDTSKTAELSVPKALNILFSFVMWLETLLVKAGLSFPVGASRLLVAQKQCKHSSELP